MPRRRNSGSTRAAAPFLKWAGGKTQILPAILKHLPARCDTYFEPFIGGGAVFFALANQGRFRRAVIGDRNKALVEVYLCVRDGVEELIECLGRHAPHAIDRDYFYGVRAIDPASLGAAERAARMIFLNKTCFNGLWRVNRRGVFNVPFGRYENPRVLDEGLLRAASRSLRGVEIVEGDFEEIVRPAGRGDAVYFDPPYHPLSRTSSFAAYSPFPFGAREHERLAGVYRGVAGRGATAVLSNSWCPFTRSLYRGLACRRALATRNINSVSSKRGRIPELLVTGMGLSRGARLR